MTGEPVLEYFAIEFHSSSNIAENSKSRYRGSICVPSLQSLHESI